MVMSWLMTRTSSAATFDWLGACSMTIVGAPGADVMLRAISPAPIAAMPAMPRTMTLEGAICPNPYALKQSKSRGPCPAIVKLRLMDRLRLSLM